MAGGENPEGPWWVSLQDEKWYMCSKRNRVGPYVSYDAACKDAYVRNTEYRAMKRNEAGKVKLWDADRRVVDE